MSVGSGQALALRLQQGRLERLLNGGTGHSSAHMIQTLNKYTPTHLDNPSRMVDSRVVRFDCRLFPFFIISGQVMSCVPLVVQGTLA